VERRREERTAGALDDDEEGDRPDTFTTAEES
jgi:hypothetical protein